MTSPITSSPTSAYRWPRDVFAVSGGDADRYLQGQLSQDVDALAPGEAGWSFVLEPQGKVVAWFRVTRRAQNDIILDVDAGYGEALVQRLERFKLRVDVTIEPLDWAVVSIKSTEPVDTAFIDHALLEQAELAVAVDWPGFVGVDLLGPNVSTGDLALMDATDFAARRIAAGVPAMGAELTPATIPNEVGVVGRSVSFTKGCYTGQELVARVDSRGNNTPRSLHLVTIDDGRPVVPGTSIEVGDVEAGVITSAAMGDGGTVALAYIKRAIETPTTGTVTIDGESAVAHIERLPDATP